MFKSKKKLFSLKLHDYITDKDEIYLLNANNLGEAFSIFMRDVKAYTNIDPHRLSFLRSVACGAYQASSLILIINKIDHEGVVKRLPLTPITIHYKSNV